MPAGRPPIYSTVDEMIPALDAWIERVKTGEEFPTITGLCLALGFDSKDTLYKYRDKPEFTYPIKKAILFVEHGYEKNLRLNTPAGSIFALKNMGWKDKTEQDIKLDGGVQINFERATNEESNG